MRIGPSFKETMIALQDIDYNERAGIIGPEALRTLESIAYAYLGELGVTPAEAWAKFYKDGKRS